MSQGEGEGEGEGHQERPTHRPTAASRAQAAPASLHGRQHWHAGARQAARGEPRDRADLPAGGGGVTPQPQACFDVHQVPANRLHPAS
jgi:hypothetical protein